MKLRAAFTAALVAIATLSSCGGGGSSDTRQQRTDVLVIGNSIALHAPADSLGWSGNWGMAASSAATDYPHKTASGLGLPVTVTNAAQNEFDATAPLPAVTVGPGTVVVVQLGDIGVPPRMTALLASVNRGAVLACLSTYWRDVDKDALLRAACTAAGGRWVDIGNIFTGRIGVFSNEAVDRHPGDAEMAEIARRIVAAVGS